MKIKQLMHHQHFVLSLSTPIHISATSGSGPQISTLHTWERSSALFFGGGRKSMSRDLAPPPAALSLFAALTALSSSSSESSALQEWDGEGLDEGNNRERLH